MQYFVYGEMEMSYLRERDLALGRVIDLVGPIERIVNPDLFESLINSIVSQQISSRAASTVKERIQGLLGNVTPYTVSKCDVGMLQQCGLSHRKVGYIKEIARAVLDGHFDLEALRSMNDEEVCKALSSLKGIGVWTAEMLMLFSMQRPDVLSYGDLAIRRGLCTLHRLSELTPSHYTHFKELYSPFGSVASLYIWEIAAGEVL